MDKKRSSGVEVAPIPPRADVESSVMSEWSGDVGRPLLSIICHTYQHQAYLADCLNGILMQRTDFPFEIILHDDASVDGTADIARDYAARYPSIIHLVCQEKNQYSRGRKPSTFTFPLVRGKYISLCEGDDYWLDPDKLRKQVAYLQAHPDCSVCAHDAMVVRDGVVVRESKLPERYKRDFDARALRRGVYVLTLTATFRNCLGESPPEHSRIRNGDNFLFSRLGQHGFFHYMGDIKPGVYRVHGGGIWSAITPADRRSSHINTSFWISQYYGRSGDMEVHRAHALRSIHHQLTAVSDWRFRDVFSLIFLFFKVRWRRRHASLYSRLSRFRHREEG